MDGKYLKYAVGEIVLVVIGILIALSINNWNEDRKDQEKASELTEKLKQELGQTAEYCDLTIEGINNQISFLQSILNNESANNDLANFKPPYGLGFLFYMSSYSQFFDPPTNTYEAAINDGSIRLLQNKELTNILQVWQQSGKTRINQIIEEEYLLGREINDYIARKYAPIFEGGLTMNEIKWNESTIKAFLESAREDGTLRYKLVERIELKQARKLFVNNNKLSIERLLEKYP